MPNKADLDKAWILAGWITNETPDAIAIRDAIATALAERERDVWREVDRVFSSNGVTIQTNSIPDEMAVYDIIEKCRTAIRQEGRQ